MAEERLNTNVPDHNISRVGEMVLAITGGIFGVLAGLFGLAIGGLQSGLTSGVTSATLEGLVAIVVSAVALVAAFFVTSKTKMAGWLLVVSAVAGLIVMNFYYILPCILLLIAGLMCLLRGRKKA